MLQCFAQVPPALLRQARIIPVILAVLLVATPPAAEAQGPPWRPPGVDQQEFQRPPPREEPEVRITLDEAVALVRQRTGGRVLRADRREQGNRIVYEVRVLSDDGRVRTYRVDGLTGAMR